MVIFFTIFITKTSICLKKLLLYAIISVFGGIMNVSLMANFFMDVKNWVYNWDVVTFSLIVIIISTLMIISLISFLKSAIKDKSKIKIMPIIFLALLTTMLVLILLARK